MTPVFIINILLKARDIFAKFDNLTLNANSLLWPNLAILRMTWSHVRIAQLIYWTTRTLYIMITKHDTVSITQ